MDLVAIVEPSSGAYPGHMVIGQEDEAGSRFFGLHLDPAGFPVEYRAPKYWQEFLYGHKILGDIRDDSKYVARIRARKPGLIYEKRIACNTSIDTILPPPETWKHWAHYSFRPDDFHTEADPCYNCVTWATMIANQLAPGFIEPVPQGRIKFIVKQFKEASGKGGTKNG